MPEKTIEERLSALEAQLENKTIGQHFREQAELIDRRFAETLRARSELFDVRIEAKVKPIKADLAIIKHAVGVLLTRLT